MIKKYVKDIRQLYEIMSHEYDNNGQNGDEWCEIASYNDGW